jgi:uncharacterized repeat protein (TIGR03803 family)
MGINTLHSFNGTDGAVPSSGLTLYGTTTGGGADGYGTIFSIGIDGAGFTSLHSFDGEDGSFPIGDLVLFGTNLFGTTLYEGTGTDPSGTVFSIGTNGSGFLTLHNFNGGDNDGANPTGTLIVLGNTLYGTTQTGGTNNGGTVFALYYNDDNFNVLYDFTEGNDGGVPIGGLVLSNTTLYGTTSKYGSNSYGSVFALQVPGLSPTLLNVQITDGGTLKSGQEAVGFSSSDPWNVIGPPLYSGDGPADGSPYFGSANLVDYMGNTTEVGVFAYCNGDDLLANDNGSDSSDPLFESCGLTGGGSDWQLQINNLPPGSYYIYCYVYLTGLPSPYPVTFTITSGGSGSATADDDSPTAVLSVSKSDFTSIVINISGDFEPVCNGIQILNAGE